MLKPYVNKALECVLVFLPSSFPFFPGLGICLHVRIFPVAIWLYCLRAYFGVYCAVNDDFFSRNVIDSENGKLNPLHFIKSWTRETHQCDECSRGWAVIRCVEERNWCRRTLIRPRDHSLDSLVKIFMPGLFILLARRFAFSISKDFHIPLKMQFKLGYLRWNIFYLSCCGLSFWLSLTSGPKSWLCNS